MFKYGIGLGRQHRNKGYGAEAVVLLLRFDFAELAIRNVTPPFIRSAMAHSAFTNEWALWSRVDGVAALTPGVGITTSSSLA